MSELRDGIDVALGALRRGLRSPVVSPGPWEEVVGHLEAALEAANAGDTQLALQHLDVSTAHLKNMAMMKRGTFELMDMEDARRDALRALDRVPRAI
jgi:hypothetical protein